MKLSLLFPLLFGPSLFAQEKVTYEDHLFPLFENSCLSCHNPDKKKGDLDLSSYPALMDGSSGGPVAISGDGASSSLYTVTTGSTEPVMPPKGDRLAKKSTDLIRTWIDGGMLESQTSTAQKVAKPQFKLAVEPSLGQPEGPPPMPSALSLDPPFVAPRAGLVKAIAASPWAPLVAITGQKQILLYHSETFRYLGSLPFPKGQPETITFHPSGKYLLAAGGTAGKSGQTIAWDITTGAQLFTAGREFDSVLAAAFTPDLSTIALGGPTRTLKIWNTRENQQSIAVKKHTDWITSLAASPDGKFFASGDRNGGIHVWDLRGNEIHNLQGHQGSITALAFRSDSQLLASTSEDGQLIIWDLQKGSPAQKVKGHNGGTTSLHYHRDGHLVTAGRDRVVKIYHPNFKEKMALKDFPEIVTAVTLSHDRSHLFAADFNGEVFIYDLDSSQAPIATLESNPPSMKDRCRELQKQLASESVKVTQATDTLSKAEETTAKLELQIDGTRKALQKNQQALARLQKQIQTATRQVKELRKESALIKKELTELKAGGTEANEASKADELNLRLKKINVTGLSLSAESRALPRREKETRALVATGQESLQALQGKLREVSERKKAAQKALKAAHERQTVAQSEVDYWVTAANSVKRVESDPSDPAALQK